MKDKTNVRTYTLKMKDLTNCNLHIYLNKTGKSILISKYALRAKLKIRYLQPIMAITTITTIIVNTAFIANMTYNNFGFRLLLEVATQVVIRNVRNNYLRPATLVLRPFLLKLMPDPMSLLGS